MTLLRVLWYYAYVPLARVIERVTRRRREAADRAWTAANRRPPDD